MNRTARKASFLLVISVTLIAGACGGKVESGKLANSDEYFDRGFLYAKSQAYEEAVKDFSEAIRLDTTNAKAYYNRGLVYFFLEKFDSAKVDWEKTRRLRPDWETRDGLTIDSSIKRLDDSLVMRRPR